MAAEAKRRTTRYEVYGNVAYDPVWEGGSVAAPRREEILHPRPNVRPKERTLARPRVQVREAGMVSPFAVLGFACIGVLAVLLLMSCVRLTVINDETVQLRSQLSRLQEEEAELLTQYELAYDLRAIEAAAIGVAMGNGQDFVKEAADYVAPDHNHDGVAHAIRKFLLDEASPKTL